MDIRVLDENPLYKDKIYRMKFQFPASYPIGTTGRPCISSRFLG